MSTNIRSRALYDLKLSYFLLVLSCAGMSSSSSSSSSYSQAKQDMVGSVKGSARSGYSERPTAGAAATLTSLRLPPEDKTARRGGSTHRSDSRSTCSNASTGSGACAASPWMFSLRTDCSMLILFDLFESPAYFACCCSCRVRNFKVSDEEGEVLIIFMHPN